MSSLRPVLVVLTALVLSCLPNSGYAAWELSGTKAIILTTAEGTRINIGSVEFMPTTESAATFKISLNTATFKDYFLSMREFKCIQGATELTCHVPYPYVNPRTVRINDLAWLEHSLLFFYKLQSDYGAKLWNGIYFELRSTDAGLVGTPKAIDLNQIAAPPDNTSIPPYGSAQRYDIPSDARWIRSLSIE